MVITLWVAQLDRMLTGEEEQRLMAALPEQRRIRLEQVRQPERRREPLCAYWLLHRALHERYGWTELPPMAYGPLGKPYFPGHPGLHFGISHTSGAVLVGLADREIGVDIERIRPVGENMLRRFGGDTVDAFFGGWVRREARAKRAETPVELRAESPLTEGEQVYRMECFPGYAACAVYLGEEEPEVRLLTMRELLY